MTQEVKQKKTIASVIKAIDVINHIAQAGREQGVTEISEALNMGVSATYHLLNTLKECNIIVQNEKTKKFKLSLKLWQIGMLAFGQNHISLIIRPYLKRLKEVTGETANFMVLDNKQVVYIAQEESNKLVKMFTKIGAAVPLHCTAGGKTLLAFQPEEKQRFILEGLELKAFTEKTITDKSALIKEMEKIKKQGYGFDDEERELDVYCIAAPVFDMNNEPVGCISISGPKNRFTEENKKIWVKAIVDIANEASEYLRNIE